MLWAVESGLLISVAGGLPDDQHCAMIFAQTEQKHLTDVELQADCFLHVQSFLHKALMPLHKPKCVGLYHQQLAYCVTQVMLNPCDVVSMSGACGSVSTGTLEIWFL